MTQPPNPAVTVLPCPFCGGEAYLGRTTYSRPLDDAWWADGSKISETQRINCASCGGNTGGGPIGGQQTPEKAIAAWNTRQSIPVAAGVGEGLREALERIAAYPSSSRITSDAHADRETLINIARNALARDALLLGGDAMRGEGQ